MYCRCITAATRCPLALTRHGSATLRLFTPAHALEVDLGASPLHPAAGSRWQPALAAGSRHPAPCTHSLLLILLEVKLELLGHSGDHFLGRVAAQAWTVDLPILGGTLAHGMICMQYAWAHGRMGAGVDSRFAHPWWHLGSQGVSVLRLCVLARARVCVLCVCVCARARMSVRACPAHGHAHAHAHAHARVHMHVGGNPWHMHEGGA